MRSLDPDEEQAQDSGNPTVTFRGSGGPTDACLDDRSRCEADEQGGMKRQRWEQHHQWGSTWRRSEARPPRDGRRTDITEAAGEGPGRLV